MPEILCLFSLIEWMDFIVLLFSLLLLFNLILKEEYFVWTSLSCIDWQKQKCCLLCTEKNWVGFLDYALVLWFGQYCLLLISGFTRGKEKVQRNARISLIIYLCWSYQTVRNAAGWSSILFIYFKKSYTPVYILG